MLFPNYSELSMVLAHNQRNGLNLIMNNVSNFHTFILEPERSAETVNKTVTLQEAMIVCQMRKIFYRHSEIIQSIIEAVGSQTQY